MTRETVYTTAAEHVYQELRHQIITLLTTRQNNPDDPNQLFTLPTDPNDPVKRRSLRLPEVSIAAKIGVSRTPVREALRRLANEGLVVIIPNSGARLAFPSRKEVEDAYAVRANLERFSARLAATRISDRQLRKLEEASLDEIQASEQKNIEYYLEVNERFHRIIAEASGNRLLAEYVGNVMARTDVYIVYYDPFYSLPQNPSIEEHRAIVEALKAHDPDKAEDAMARHIALSESVLAKPNDHSKG